MAEGEGQGGYRLSATGELGLSDDSQARMMLAATAERALAVPAVIKDKVRCGVLKSMVVELLSQ